ncbi:ABC transporter substrate-binding protein [Parapusillimonas sp. SGNA-6]|jgi:branched-chain amino acid transport system substrate-binding protein|nr:ABC transporter substrate-binding protein [Parapusillimonas sp. SGNA-6]
MNSDIKLRRRQILKMAGAATATLAAPLPLRHAWAADPIKIGIPCALSGPFAHLGEQTKRAAEIYVKELNAKGGVNGRPLEIIVEDTQGNPAVCVRKVQEFVERRHVNIFTGLSISPESLAVSPRLDEWNALYISSGAGDGRLTAEALVPNFFRSNASSPMGARIVSRYIEDSDIKKVFAIGQDYAWGHNSVGVLEAEIKRGSKEFVGKLFTPTATKDFSSYIAKIRAADADALYIVLTGDDNNAFMTQAASYHLFEKMSPLMEFIEHTMVRSIGDAALGLIGSSRWPFTLDNPLSQHFSKAFYETYGVPPDLHAGELYQTMDFIVAAINKTHSTDTGKLRAALEGMEIESLKGKVVMRKCDHQAVADGYLIKCVKDSAYPYPVPQVIKTYPGDFVTPKCNSQTYDA